MAAVEVTITGVLFDKYNRTGRPVTLVGDASLTGLGVGGGPMPPGEGGGGGPPPGIWGGPIDPYPGHPLPPGWGTWPPQRPPHPAHPIVLPPETPPEQPPTEPPTEPPNVTWVWGWDRANGWHPVYVPPAGSMGPHEVPPG